MKTALVLFISIISLLGAPAFADNETIKAKIIKESVDSYPGNCPCPYNKDSRGHKCGKRSAYSRAGGYETICYPDDVTDEMIKEYAARNMR